MARPRKGPQPRSHTLGVAVTAEERMAVAVVAAARGVNGDSTLLREMSLDDIVAEYRRLRSIIERAERADLAGAPA